MLNWMIKKLEKMEKTLQVKVDGKRLAEKELKKKELHSQKDIKKNPLEFIKKIEK